MKLNDLKTPFDPADVEFRAGATNKDKTSALALPYLTSRAVMDRLDSVCGPENWQDVYMAGPDGGVLCGISVKVGDAWITKFDGAENSNIEAVKGGLSDAFKRAGVKWGIGRYLYSLPSVWVKAEQRGNSVTIDEDEARKKLFGQQQAKPDSRPVQPVRSEAAPAKPTNGQKQLNPQALFELVQKKTSDYYNNPNHLYTTIGGWPNFKDQDDVLSAVSAAVDHANKNEPVKA